VNPETIKQYLPVTDVISEWRVDSPIVWKSEFQGRPCEVRGTVLHLEPERLLEYDHSRPIFRASRAPQSPERYQRVTIELKATAGERTFRSPSRTTRPRSSSSTPREAGEWCSTL
jgi:Activator of Hsp90 ATPase homolog 1-like protein